MTEVMGTSEAHVARLLEAAWARPAAHDVLQAIAEGVTEVLDFGVAVVSVRRETDTMEVVAVAGDDDARQTLMGRHTRLADIDAELAVAESWGTLRFVPHGRLPDEVVLGWIPDIEVDDDPDAWHPLDLLVAPLHDAEGALRGMLAVDLPADGRRPGQETRDRLERYAAQAARALVAAVERESLHEEVRLASATRAIVRAASARLDLDGIVRECQPAIFSGLRVDGFWLQLLEQDDDHARTGDREPGRIIRHTGDSFELPTDLVALAARAARAAWHQQAVAVVSRRRPPSALVSDAERDRILEHLDATGVASIMFVPLGAGTECLGSLVLTRTQAAYDWTDVEAGAALDIGHDLGRAILNARTFGREQRLVAELQAVDRYRSQLVSTVTHELRTPLTVVSGHTELLLGEDGLDAPTRRSLEAVSRAAGRIDRLVDDLQLLSRAGDPHLPLERQPVDLAGVVPEVAEMFRLAARERGVEVVVESAGPAIADGDPVLLDRVCQNLIGNAVKYSPRGGRVSIRLRRSGGDVELRVTDEGLGIAPEDIEHLFTEFFRSADPEAQAQPGTGLGLAIVDQIVRRHGGAIAVDSTPGRGSTFTVTLPAGSTAY